MSGNCAGKHLRCLIIANESLAEGEIDSWHDNKRCSTSVYNSDCSAGPASKFVGSAYGFFTAGNGFPCHAVFCMGYCKKDKLPDINLWALQSIQRIYAHELVIFEFQTRPSMKKAHLQLCFEYFKNTGFFEIKLIEGEGDL